MQFQFRYPKGYEHAKWKKSIAPGLEIRAHSNYYVVAPPSMHRSGVRYEYENPESARIYAPQWLIDLAEQRQTGINLVSETALKGERHHNIVAIAGMNRHKDIPLDTALNQCLDYNKNHCSPSKAEYLVRNAVTDVYRRYEPGRVPKSVREEFFLTTSDLTRGERLLLKVAKKSTDNGKKVFKFLYDETGLSDDCPRKYTPRDVLNLLVEKHAYWCNGDTVRMTHLLRNSKRMNEFPEEDTGGLEAWVSLQAEAVVDGFKDADVIEYLDEGGRGLVVSTDLVSKDICSHNYFLTFEDDRQRSDRFEMYNYDGKIYVKTGRSVIEQEVETLTKHRATTTIAREVVEKISRLTRHDREEIDANTPLELIPLRDKIYNIKTDEFTDYSPDLPFFMRYAGMYKPELLDAKSEAIGVLEISYKSKT